MKKRLFFILLAMLLCFSITCPALAQGAELRLVDNAGLLNSSETIALLSELNEISNAHQVDLVIVTTNIISPKTPREYADDFFDYNGYGYGSNRDGVLLLISMEDSDWYISTSGFGITAFTSDGIDYIGEQITPDLSNGNYDDAFRTYIDLCDEFITAAKNGNPYNRHNLPKSPFPVVSSLLISLTIGFVLAFIVTAVLKSQLKSIRSQSGAGSYVQAGSLNITDQRDLFLYRNVSRRPKPQSSSSSGTHHSSSGRSHGGGGGKF